MKISILGSFSKEIEEDAVAKLKGLGVQPQFIANELIKYNPEEFNNKDFWDAEGIVCNGFFLHNDPKQFKNLKFVQLTSAGYDRVPIDYFKENEIVLQNAKGVYSTPIAEWTIAKILDIYKKSFLFYENQKEKKWEKEREIPELAGKSVCILGAGDIGHEIAKRLRAFSVNQITGFDIREWESTVFDEIIFISELSREIDKYDIVIVTLPLTEETQHLLDCNMMASMKKDSVLVNVSRGKVIDEEALIKLLDQGFFQGVVLDVFEMEPLNPESKLWTFENVIITPHNSFVGENNRKRMGKVLIDQIEKYLMTKENK